MNKASPRLHPLRAQRGLTLVELMVSVVLGMLTVLVVTQVTLQAEGRRRTISMGSDAQVNGSLALFAMQRDIQMSGYGAVVQPDALGCTVTGKFGAAAAFSFPLAPVVITNGLNGAPDTLTVLLSRTGDSSVPARITEIHPQANSSFVVDAAMGVRAGDLMIAVPKTQSANTQCALVQVTTNTAAPATTLSSTRIPHTSAGSSWNQSAALPAGGYVVDSYLLNMGDMVARTYSVSATQNLQTTERSRANGNVNTADLFPQIVTLQALYGKDTDADDVVDTYDNTTPNTNAGWLQVRTIRLAIVARSNQFEKTPVTTSQPLWDVGSTTVQGTVTANCHTSSQCITLQVNQTPDWQHYRYKVYETVIPLRNVLWNS